MCGISGWYSDEGSIDKEILKRINTTMQKRGPDGEGFYFDKKIGFGHRRLSIIDLSDFASQPMQDSEGRWVITFNGEIYNYHELRKELQSLGHQFRTQSDTEVLLEAYKQWGESCLGRLNGMFAFAIWDKKQESLCIARDRLGKKPLFFWKQGKELLFASELKALLSSGKIAKKIDPKALAQYLEHGYTLTDSCLIEGVQKLAPGHFMKMDTRGFHPPQKWWFLENHYRQKLDITEFEAERHLRELMDSATRLRMISDVPLGAFLSGGVDSSVVVSDMVKHAEKVRSYSIGFEEKEFDESAQAAEVAQLLGVNHHQKTVSSEISEIFSDLVLSCDEPIADNSIVPMYYLCQYARDHVTVALTGDGGDEVFLGYETYVADQIYEKLHPMAGLLAPAMRTFSRCLPAQHGKVSLDQKLHRFSNAFGLNPLDAHLSWRHHFTFQELGQILNSKTKAEVLDSHSEDFQENLWREGEDLEFLDHCAYLDFKTWLADDLLVKADRMSMAHSLELRSPLLDYRIVEFAASLPADFKIIGTQKKRILKNAYEDTIPRRILDRKKRGFNAPISLWLEKGLSNEVQEMLKNGPVLELVNHTQVKALMDDHQSKKSDNSFKLFNLLMLNKWMQVSF